MVNTLVDALREACEKHKFTSKKLIVDNLLGGHQLLEGAARSGAAWLNVTPVTPLQLATALATPELEKKGFSILSEGQILNLLDEELAKMRDDGRLIYFADLEGAEGLAGILMSAIIELRAAGLTAAVIKSAAFVDPQKGEEIKALLQAYEERLQLDQLADTADVYRVATALHKNRLKVADGTLYLIPGQLEFSALEYAFIEACTENARLVLPEEPVFKGDPEKQGQVDESLLKGLHFETKSSGKSVAVSYATGLAYLEHPQAAPSDPGIAIELSRAYGPANEVNDLLQKLLKDKVKLDQVRVCYTDASIYVPLFYSLAAQYGVPVTFGDGYSTVFTRPGKLLEGLLCWLADNFLVNHLSRLFYSGLIETDNPAYLVRTLRQAKIGWGYERYKVCLEEAVKKAEERLEKEQAQAEAKVNAEDERGSAVAAEDSEGTPDYRQFRLENAQRAKKLIEDIFAALPEPGPAPDNKVDFLKLCRGLARLIKDYAKVKSSDDAAAKEAIVAALEDAALSHNGSLELKAAVKRIRSRLSGLKINASGGKPGHLHLTAIGKGEWCPRTHTFIVGLQSGSFPGSGLQDPILLDGERQQISPHLMLKAMQPVRNRMRLNRLLASCRGHLYLSYSSFSPVEARPTMPAASLLQVYRLLNRKPEADYSELEKALSVDQAVYYPAEPDAALFINQWWLYLSLLDKKLAVEPAAIRDCFPGLQEGFVAAEQRKSDQFTAYDGQVTVDPAEVDPTENHDLTFSASRLEKLGNCPFAFFVQNMLGVELPDEQEYKPGSWLDVMTRGHLLHQIYAEFMNRVKGGRLEPEQEKVLIRQIGSELIEERKAEVPPPSEVVYKYEKQSLLNELETFLKVEKSLRDQGYSPLYLEAPFGIDNPQIIAKAGAGLPAPVEIEIEPGVAFKLRGIIDRIDQVLGDSPRYGVWDYKTGSTYGYQDNQYLNKGRQLQHALYAIAAEKILEQAGLSSPVVSEGGYIFPTQKGEGITYSRDQRKRQQLLSALSRMFKLLSSGTFCVTEEDRCKFCDYQELCRVSSARQQIKVKLENQANSVLEPWRELQKYE